MNDNYSLFDKINEDSPGYGTNKLDIKCGRIAVTKYGNVHSQCLDDTIRLMQYFLKKQLGGKFVEIGVLGGASLLYNHDLCKKNGIEIYGIDPFEDIIIFNGKTEQNSDTEIVNFSRSESEKRRLLLEEIIKKDNLNINVIKKTSGEAAKLFEDNSIGLLHIDGDHSYDGVKKDLNMYWSKIKSGGVIINDDYAWGCCKKAINEFVKNKDAEIITSYQLAKSPTKHIIIKL